MTPVPDPQAFPEAAAHPAEAAAVATSLPAGRTVAGLAQAPETAATTVPAEALATRPAQRQALAAAALGLLERCLARTDVGPPGDARAMPSPEALAAWLQPPTDTGRPEAELMAVLLAAAQAGCNKRHPGDLAYMPSAGLYSGAIAALLAAGLHGHTASAHEAPGLVALEEGVLRWLAGVLGLPPDSEGLLLSGGSLANQTAVACARAWAAPPPAGPMGALAYVPTGAQTGAQIPAQASAGAPPGLAYLGEQAHHSLAKALHLSGLPPGALRHIPSDAQGRLDVAALQRQIDADRRAGLRPWLLLATAGSTDTGAIDDLPALTRLAAAHGLWCHVDAAYGGLFALTARGAERLQGLAAADSVTVDAHKGLQLPYGAAALLVRRPGALARAHAARGPYLRDLPAAPQDLPNYFERGPEQTRPFRGLLLWLPLHWHGVAAFRQALDHALDQAALAAQRLAAWPECELLQAPPALSIVAFRARAGDDTTARWLAVLNGSDRLHVASTQVGGRLAIRLAFLQPGSGQAQVDQLLALLQSAAA